jgi:ABC-type cobalt transport system substrate-binding protein|tara:strand:- start:109 stop:459 length:351 start_codon:yes stop_codon:yes gene_type:complete
LGREIDKSHKTALKENDKMKKFNCKATAVTFGLLWGGLIFLVHISNLTWPGYGQAALDVIASIYPGYHPTASFAQVLIGTLYGLLDGAVGGVLFAWLYNLWAEKFAGCIHCSHGAE